MIFSSTQTLGDHGFLLVASDGLCQLDKLLSLQLFFFCSLPMLIICLIFAWSQGDYEKAGMYYMASVKESNKPHEFILPYYGGYILPSVFHYSSPSVGANY